MDLGLFNKVPMAMGDHGTLIGNWVEERALRDATGFERHVPFTGAASAASLSDMRIVTHSDNMDDDSKKHMKQSIAKTSFQRPDARAYKQEVDM